MTSYGNTPAAIEWQSPANIALIKYWGKKGHQLPANPSLSFTLQRAFTRMRLEWEKQHTRSGKPELTFYFEGKDQPFFRQKIADFLCSIMPQYPFLGQLKMTIYSENSFPHSAGIASSASSMSALALCLCTLEENITGNQLSPEQFYQKASILARMASGSASRSVYGGFVTWGKIDHWPHTSDTYASPLPVEVHKVFDQIHDTVLIVSRSEKGTSSRAGHALMDVHPYKNVRYEQAHKNLKELITALQTGNLEVFGRIIEEEALTLHALMMTSRPSVVLLQANSIAIVHRVRTFRAETCLPVYFTIDAGPNIHLIYPDSAKSDIQRWISSEMLQFCEANSVMDDQIGKGPQRIK